MTAALPYHTEEGIKTVFGKVIALRGTWTGEHGIGTARSKYMHLGWDQLTLDFVKGIKEASDPRGMLNPGRGVGLLCQGNRQ